MKDKSGIPHHHEWPPPKIPYTYFGQFIMHDLTQDDTPLSKRNPPDPAEIVNHRSPLLNLDSVYGRGPASEDACLYEIDGISLKLGSACTDKGVPFDVPLHPHTRRPLIADARNGENLIIRQIHAMFLKLHNAAVEEAKGKVPCSVLFETAQQRVRQQYQWLIRNPLDGFLIRVCNTTVYNEIVSGGKYHVEWDDAFAIPVEFAHAGARFGHSMVRSEYTLNKDKVSLAQIFRESHKRGALRPDFAIDWRRLLKDGANSIDTSVVGDLFQLGPRAIQPFVERIGWLESLKLPIRTLYRHIRMKLPTGEQLREVLDANAVLKDPPPGFPDYHPFKALEELGLRGKTPLWYYILLEAELNERGANLGPIGSRLICEVIEGALRATPSSILLQISEDPAWRPASWAVPNRQPMDINNLLDMAIVVGLAE